MQAESEKELLQQQAERHTAELAAQDAAHAEALADLEQAAVRSEEHERALGEQIIVSTCSVRLHTMQEMAAGCQW